MGPAHCSVVNQTEQRLCVITFNNADIIYKSYHTMYIVNPGESSVVEANPDPIGLKLGIIYSVDPAKQDMMYHRFHCKNDGVLNITEMKNDDVSYYGYRDDAVLHAKGKIRESQQIPFSMAADVLHVDITAVEKVSKPIFSDKPAKILKEVREQISAAKQTIEKVFDPEEEERRKAIEKWENEINRVKEAARLSAEIEFEARLAKEREAILEAIARSQAQDAKKYNLESLGGDSNIVPARTSSPETNVQDISISLGRNSLGQNDTPTISDSRSRNGSSCTELPVASNASSSNNTLNSQSSISVTPSQAQPTLVSTTASVSLSKDSSSASIASTSTSATTSGNSSMNISSSNSTSTMSQPSSSVVSSDSSMGVVNDQTANQSSTYHHNQGVLVPTPRNRKKSTSEPVMEIGNASSENGDVDMPVQEVVDMKCKCAVM